MAFRSSENGSRKPRSWLDFVKAVVSFGLIFVWSPLALRLVPDTNLGVTIVVAPDVIFVFLALLFISNGLSKLPKSPFL